LKNFSPENLSSDFVALYKDFVQSVVPGSLLRMAPTPSGFLHKGNILNFYLNWYAARSRGASLLLRIDDLDADRKRPEYVANIFETLRHAGFDWNIGPGAEMAGIADCVADFEVNWSQHRRLHLYHGLLARLRETGLLFACRKSRKDIAAAGAVYPPEFRDQGLSLDEPDVAWRIKTDGLDPSMQDFVVRRRDGIPAYQVASVADDLHFGVTHVIRGEDLEPSTRAQIWLAGLLGERAFMEVKFLHHPLVRNEQGEKLSKSAGDGSRGNYSP
jgi:glutamyl-tRNA synthetase